MTSLGAYIVGTRVFALNRDKLVAAIMEMLECLGLTVVFLLINLAAGTALVLGLRTLTGRFISIYWLNDTSFVILSLVQALTFHCWRRRLK
jgi:membrane protein implicated in regulation of membrane protease activity